MGGLLPFLYKAPVQWKGRVLTKKGSSVQGEQDSVSIISLQAQACGGWGRGGEHEKAMTSQGLRVTEHASRPMRRQPVVSRIRSRDLRVAVVLRRWNQLLHLTVSHLIAPYPTAPLPIAKKSKALEKAGSTASMPKKRGHQRSSGIRSRTAQTELSFSVSHMEHLLRKGHYAQRLSSSAPVFLAAVIQDLTSKVLELAGNEAQKNGEKRITPKLVDMAIHNNALLSSIFGMTTISLVAPGPH